MRVLRATVTSHFKYTLSDLTILSHITCQHSYLSKCRSFLRATVLGHLTYVPSSAKCLHVPLHQAMLHANANGLNSFTCHCTKPRHVSVLLHVYVQKLYMCQRARASSVPQYQAMWTNQPICLRALIQFFYLQMHT